MHFKVYNIVLKPILQQLTLCELPCCFADACGRFGRDGRLIIGRYVLVRLETCAGLGI